MMIYTPEPEPILDTPPAACAPWETRDWLVWTLVILVCLAAIGMAVFMGLAHPRADWTNGGLR